ncbi:Uncharacterised protein [Mycobacteroides abscessus subsp. abscessus]|nr:Uncharacterised protein [Mycobacteroides abscessus subsp. abscessus]
MHLGPLRRGGQEHSGGAINGVLAGRSAAGSGTSGEDGGIGTREGARHVVRAGGLQVHNQR